MKSFSVSLPKLLVYASVIGVALLAASTPWDTLQHLTAGHTTFAPPHLLAVGGIFLFAGSASGVFFLLRRRVKDPALKRGLFLAFLGSGPAFTTGAFFDEFWHRMFGLDQTAWSPPHLVIATGILVGLYGVAIVASSLGSKNAAEEVTSHRTVLVWSAVFCMLFIHLLEYDVPEAATSLSSRPSMFYVLVGSTILTLGFLLALPFLKRTGSLTLAALIAWIFFAGAGQIVGWGANAHFLFAPLPIIVPAFIVEVARYIYRRKQRLAMSLKPLIGLAVVAAAASFWSIVAWAVVTQIPQQELAGGPAYWLLWFSVLLVAAPCFGYMAYRIAKLLPPRTSLAS